MPCCRMIICQWPNGSKTLVWCHPDMLVEAQQFYEYTLGSSAVIVAPDPELD